MKKKLIHTAIFLISLVLINWLSSYVYHRFDLTSEKRYSISDNTKKLLRNLDEEITIKVYLDGDLNSSFYQLKKSVKDILEEFKAYDKHRKLTYEFINPSEGKNNKERNEYYAQLESRGLKPIVVHDTDSEGEMIQKVMFPWAEFSMARDTSFLVNLLKNIPGYGGEENINASIESLEFELTDALRVITAKEIMKIAFIEGHGELPEQNVFDITNSFSRYYQIDRGVLGSDASVLDGYKAIIIAGPQEKYSESDKFIIDQYVMKGGKVLWLVDGVSHINMDSLQIRSSAIALPKDINLNDILFRYGVRINANLVQDLQCAYIPVNLAPIGEKANYKPAPWYYSPLLLTSPYHPITKNLTPVKAEFASSIDLVNNESKIQKTVILATSSSSNSMQAPIVVNVNMVNEKQVAENFVMPNQPVAVSLEGCFPSIFANRMVPKDIEYFSGNIIQESKPTKMVVCSSSSLIRNQTMGVGENMVAVPLGYDRYMNQQFGNKDFILNAVNFLTDDEGWMNLRTRELKIRLLNKKQITTHKTFWKMVNVVGPLVVLMIFGVVFLVVRSRKYKRK